MYGKEQSREVIIFAKEISQLRRHAAWLAACCIRSACTERSEIHPLLRGCHIDVDSIVADVRFEGVQASEGDGAPCR